MHSAIDSNVFHIWGFLSVIQELTLHLGPMLNPYSMPEISPRDLRMHNSQSVYRWFTQSTIRANSQDDSRRMMRATGNDSRNSMDVSRKQAAVSCFFPIKI